MKLSQIALSATLGLGAIAALSSGAEAAKFQKYVNNSTCGQAPSCEVDFGTVPPGKTLEITDASCYLRTSTDANFYALQLNVFRGTNFLTAVTLGPMIFNFSTVAPGESTLVYQVNNPIKAFATAGQRFAGVAQIRFGEFKQFACHITGEMTP